MAAAIPRAFRVPPAAHDTESVPELTDHLVAI
jgi:hypothetical protein